MDLRKIDALVAEHVMGWHNNVADPENERGMWGIMDGRGSDGTPVLAADFPAYSSDIAAAWEVVEHLCPTANREEPWFRLYDSSGAWVANFHRGTPDVSAHSAPLAICLAALASVGVEPPRD